MGRSSLCCAVAAALLRSSASLQAPAHMLRGATRAAPRRTAALGSTTRALVTMMPQGEPQVPWKPPGSDQAMFVGISQRLFRERIILMGDFLDEDKSNNMIAMLLYMKQEDPNKPISLYVNIPGALMKPTLAIYDTLQSMDCPIVTLNLGLATGMAAFLCGAGTKGMRYCLPNARYLMQRTGLDDPYQGQARDIGLMVSENKRDNERVERELAKMTGRSYEQVAKDMGRDFYLSGFEARDYGLIDKVLVPEPSVAPEAFFDALSGGGAAQQEIGFGVFGGDDKSKYQGDSQDTPTLAGQGDGADDATPEAPPGGGGLGRPYDPDEGPPTA